MKKLKILIIGLIIIIVIIAGTLIWIKKDKEDYPEKYFNDTDMGINEELEYSQEEVTDIEYFKIQGCISMYLQKTNKKNSTYYEIDENGNNVKIVEDKEINNIIFNLLSDTYIKENNINIDNIKNFIDEVDENVIFNTVDIKKVNGDSNIKQFVVSGFMNNVEYKFIKNSIYIVNIEEEKNIFSIEPVLYNYNNIDEVPIKNCNNIIQNEDNEIPNVAVSTEQICKEYLALYKRMALSNPEIAYEYLDKDYKQKRFGNVENYKKYIEDNKEEISTIRLLKYTGEVNNDYDEYICIDQYENTYIFDIFNVCNYKIIADTYTLDLPEFLESYNSTNNQGKTALNIQKFIQAINEKDYSYAYSKLADSFKNNYFNTEKDFEEYINNKLFSHNSIQFNTFSVQGDVNSYKIILTDQTGNSKDEINLNIVMQLQEGTDFVMSFEV